MRRTKAEIVLERVAKSSWILQMAKALDFPPRPPELAEQDALNLKDDVVYLLSKMPGGDTEANRKKLYVTIQSMVRDFAKEAGHALIFLKPKRKRKK